MVVKWRPSDDQSGVEIRWVDLKLCRRMGHMDIIIDGIVGESWTMQDSVGQSELKR